MIGISLIDGGSVGVPVLAAVFISNLPEAIGSSRGMREDGMEAGVILRIWTLVVVISTIAAGAGYGLLQDAPDNTVALLDAFAGGAVLMVLVDTMIPEAHREGGRKVGFATVLGFALAYLLSTL